MDRRKEKKSRGSVPWDEPYERRENPTEHERIISNLETIKAWRKRLNHETVSGAWGLTSTDEHTLLSNIDWLILNLEKALKQKQKILRSLGCQI